MEALFACTKCHKRHSFEELSADEQLCKSCQKHGETVRCIYCRVEYKNDNSKEGSSSICKGCSHFSKLYGKPKACDYCKEIAAFVGTKCQRCAHQEKKYGQPKLCERCKNICAFDRGAEYRKSMEGKMLCWLCIVAYKKMYRKQKKPETTSNKSSAKYSPLNNNNSTTPPLSTTSASNVFNNDKIFSFTRDSNNSSNNGTPNLFSKNDDSDLKIDFDSIKKSDDKITNSSPRKRKLEKVPSFSAKKGQFEFDFGSSEHMTTITQLKENIESLKRQLLAKDQVILQKDQKITELKAQQFEMDKQTRNKIQQLQKSHDESVENMQLKIRELQKIANSVNSRNGKKLAATS